MHVNIFFIKLNPYKSPHNVFVLVHIITHHQCLLLASLISRFTFYKNCLGVEQQMQTLNSNSYKADIISGNIEADREAIEMQIDCWGRDSREKKLARMTMQVNHSSLSRRPCFVTKLGMNFSTSAATALKRIIFKNRRKWEIKVLSTAQLFMLRLRNACKVSFFFFPVYCHVFFKGPSYVCWFMVDHECERL